MNPAPVPPEPESRQAKAAKIAANPSGYKVCEGCDSIVGAGAVLCPNCHSYRFDASAERVIQQANALGSREQTSVTAGDLS
ncbi:Zn-finger protein [Haloferula sp. BvORR071]|uniref:Zn-finger protein n=1 Tax=Haloferula sp. BvORR071 TaxID=1396141 RepID=UPI00054EBC3F|nr:Zn-finger protein [Haloferula sp. BvORR071]